MKLNTKTECDFCKSESIQEVYTPINSRRKSKVFLCLNCGLLQTLYEKKEEEKIVSISCDADWGNIRHGKRARIEDNLFFIKKYLNFNEFKNIIDIGSNRGDFVKWAKKFNPRLSITAIEPDISLVDYDNLGIDIIKKRVEEIYFNKKYNFIYCSHTLEHLDSVFNFLEICNSILTNKGFIFIEVPNTEIISQDKNIVEEFFIDKHKFHFTSTVLENIFSASGFCLLKRKKDRYNLTYIFRKEKNRHSKLTIHSTIKKEKDFVSIYSKRLSENRNLLVKVCQQKLNPFMKRQRVAFWGASRIFDALIKYGRLEKKLIFLLVDKFISQILQEVHGIAVKEPEWLKIFEPDVVCILARSSTKSLETVSHEMGFRWVITFDEIMEQSRFS